MTLKSSKPALTVIAVIYTLATPSAQARESVTHQYDGLCRLVQAMKAGAAVALVTPVSAVQAVESVTHEYDALGRMVQPTKSGGPVSGIQTTTIYNPAGYRSNQKVTGPINSIGWEAFYSRH